MIKELEHRIRERAHTIWESEGRPADRAEIHWSMASAEIAAEAPAKRPAKPRAAKAASAPKAERTSTVKSAAKAAKPKASKG